MQQVIETAGIVVMLIFIWIVVPAYVIWKLWRRRYPSRRAHIEPVGSNLPRVRRERVTEIDGEYGADYRGPGREGEPFFSPGGIAFLATLVAGFLFSLWFSDLIRPLVEWLVPRSPR